jgi:hypothetical protein
MPEYYTQPKNEIAAPLRNWEHLRASGNLTFREMIALIQELWNEGQPDIPLLPTQGKNFAKYPCIVYGIENKTTANSDDKRRHREFVKDQTTGQIYRVVGQVFNHIISFTVITENEPDLAEAIMELFEDFMEEITPVLQKLGISNIWYGRRLSDSDENRDAEDICKRAVVYRIHLERVRQIPVDRFDTILVRARTFLESIRDVFTATSGTDYIVVQTHALTVGAEVVVHEDLDNPLPEGLHHGWRYTITAIDGNKLYLQSAAGDAISITADGVGRLAVWLGHVEVDIQDEYATPNT